MRIEGRFLDGHSSRPHAACLVFDGERVWVDGADGALLHAAQTLRTLNIASRLGNTPRFIRFPDGQAFETTDNDAVDRMLSGHAPHGTLIHRLESSLRYVLLGLLVTLAFVWGSVQWGVPALARVAAGALPADIHRYADQAVMEILDRQWLKPSTLPAQERERLLQVFAPLLAEMAPTQPLRVEFRDAAGTLDANALALPAGTIVFTDQLITLARADEELLGVLAHEIGHVAQRHAMRAALQASLMSLLAVVVVGDVSSVSSLLTSIPLILTELGYSRAFEHEADAHAVATLVRHGIEVQPFADLLQRLDPGREGAPSYLSTHPPTAQRIQAILGH